jgi:CheY-like chemotaxis protein
VKIHSQLTLLVVAVLAPVALLAAFSIERLWDLQVTTAADGRSGLATILSVRPDIALIDLGLPGVDGLQVARAVRAARKEGGALLIALTGYGSEGDRQQALAAGFDAFLIKPFDLAKFQAAALRAQ